MRFVALCLLAACSSPRADVLVARQLPAAEAADVANLTTANNQFGCDLYAQLGSGNTFFSPFSIATALAMLDAGAAGQTDAELRTAMHLMLAGDPLFSAYGALLSSLDTGRSYDNYTLATADRLFGQQGFPFLSTYLGVTKTDFEAQLESVDFTADDGETARATINAWVASQTDNKIPELFPKNSINAGTVLALANAILFKGTWANQFDPAQTQTGAFHVAGGSDVQAMLMHASQTVALAPITGGKLGLLPFAGNDLAMVILLPDSPDGLPALEAGLTGASIASAVAAAQSADNVTVALPKLQLTESFDLVSILMRLGIVSAFDPGTADLSGIDGEVGLFVQDAVHKATLTVDEEGAKATAATGISVGDSGESMPPSLIADHSFALAIYDQVTGSVLFMGRVSDPTLAM